MPGLAQPLNLTPINVRLPNIAGAAAGGRRAGQALNVARQTQQVGTQNLALGEQRLAAGERTANVEELKLISNAIRNVTDQASWDAAMVQLSLVIPDFNSAAGQQVRESIAPNGVFDINKFTSFSQGLEQEKVKFETLPGGAGITTRADLLEARRTGEDVVPIAGTPTKKEIKLSESEAIFNRMFGRAPTTPEEIKQFDIDRGKIRVTEPKFSGDLQTFNAINKRVPNDVDEFVTFLDRIKKQPKNKRLAELKKSYFQAIGRANAATLGVGQFVPDPNRQQIADQEIKRAEELKNEYIRSGGRPADLGIAGPVLERTGKISPIPKAAPQVTFGDIIRSKTTGKRLVWDGESWVPIGQ